jgi:hypothetical protein
MPFVVMRRADLPDGLVQLDDLKPNKSQQNYIYEPPGQSGYVSQIPTFDDVAITAGPPDVASATYTGLAAYLMDHVEDAVSTAAITPAVANAASTAIVGLARTGSVLDLAAIDAELITAGAATGLTAGNSTGAVNLVLDILAGAQYTLPAGAVINDALGVFEVAQGGSFTSPARMLFQTSSFNVSRGAGDIFNFLRADFTYNGTLTPTLGPALGVGPAIVVYADDGTLL